MPFVVVSSIFVYLFVNVPLKKVDTAPHKRIDYFGALHIVVFLTLFLLALNTGGTVVPWTHPLVLVCLPLSFVFLAAFVYTEKHVAKEPIIPLGIFQDRTVAATCLNFLFMVMSVYCAVRYPPANNEKSTERQSLVLLPPHLLDAARFQQHRSWNPLRAVPHRHLGWISWLRHRHEQDGAALLARGAFHVSFQLGDRPLLLL